MVFGSEDAPQWPLRRLNALVNGLPLEAAAFREDKPSWTQRDELLATVIEVVDAWGRQTVSAVVSVQGGKVKLPEPLRIEHPDRPKPEKTEVKSTSVAAFERLIKNGKGVSE